MAMSKLTSSIAFIRRLFYDCYKQKLLLVEVSKKDTFTALNRGNGIKYLFTKKTIR